MRGPISTPEHVVMTGMEHLSISKKYRQRVNYCIAFVVIRILSLKFKPRMQDLHSDTA